jgi:hypothetical protein
MAGRQDGKLSEKRGLGARIMAATAMAVSMLLVGVVPLAIAVAIGVVAMRGVLAALEVAVTQTLATSTPSVAPEAVVEATPGVVIPFARERREREAVAEETETRKAA